MTKIKEKLYEHRFGLFFFGFLMCFGLFFKRGFFPSLDESITLSIYAMDFSVGFTTRVLPGAIYKLFAGEYSQESATVFYYISLTFCYSGIAFLSERFLKVFDDKHKAKAFAVITLFLTVFCITAVVGIAALLLDLHWFIAAVIFFICLSDKRLYWFIPVTFIYIIMSHFAGVLCYIPMFFLVMVYKSIVCEDKREKKYILSVLAVSVTLAAGLLIYMLICEKSNVNYTFEEFVDMLYSKGITVTDYYCFHFFGKDVEQDLWLGMFEQHGVELITVDTTQPKIIVLLQTIYRQIQSTLMYGGHLKYFSWCVVIFLPVVVFTVALTAKKIKDKSLSKAKKFVYFNGVALFFFALITGFLFSTDTTRWTGHATTVTFLTFLYIMYTDKQEREDIMKLTEGIPAGILSAGLILSLLATT